MSLISKEDIIKFYNEKEKELAKLKWSEKIKRLEEYHKEIQKKGESNAHYIKTLERKLDGISESLWDKYQKIEDEIVRIDKKWKHDIITLKTLGKPKKISQLDLRLRRLYTDTTNPPAVKFFWEALMSVFGEKLAERVNIPFEILTSEQYVKSVTLDGKHISFPIDELVLEYGQHNLVITFKDVYEKDPNYCGLLSINNSGASISCQLVWDGKNFSITGDAKKFEPNLVNNLDTLLEENNNNLSNQSLTTVSKLNI